MPIPPAAVVGGAAAGGLLYAGYTGKKIYDAIVDDLDPEGTFSLFAQPPVVNVPGKGMVGQAPRTPDEDQRMADKLAGGLPNRQARAPEPTASPETPDYSGDGSYQEASPEPAEAPVDWSQYTGAPAKEKAPAPAAAAPVAQKKSGAEKRAALPAKDPQSQVISDGQWSYEIMPNGNIRFLSVPANSRMYGEVIDPSKVGALPDGPAKQRLTKAIESIQAMAASQKPQPTASEEPATVETQQTPAAKQAAQPEDGYVPPGRLQGARRIISRFSRPGAGADGSGAF